MKKNVILFILFLVLAAAAAFYYFKNTGSSISENPLSDFAIEDTSRVNKIIITDQLGEMATLERIAGNKLWRLNNKYFAREDAVNLILKTINRIRIRGNVSDNARDNMLKLLATSGKRVEIFTGGDKPAKIYYVGVATPDHTGTIMLLEIPGIGRSEEPYITHIEGFTGFLSTRFFTNESEWRYTGIFEFPQLEFSSVKMINHLVPKESFEVKLSGRNDIQLYDEYDSAHSSFPHRVVRFDTIAVQNFLLRFKKLHVETFNTLLPQQKLDSLKSAAPSYSIIVTGKNNIENKVDLLLKRAPKEAYDDNGNRILWDVEYYWARTSENEIGMAQTYNFAPLVNPIEAYLRKE